MIWETSRGIFVHKTKGNILRGVGGSRKHDIMREAKGKDYISTLWTAAGDGALPGIDSRFSTVKPMWNGGFCLVSP